jgi:hypothetical protein
MHRYRAAATSHLCYAIAIYYKCDFSVNAKMPANMPRMPAIDSFPPAFSAYSSDRSFRLTRQRIVD